MPKPKIMMMREMRGGQQKAAADMTAMIAEIEVMAAPMMAGGKPPIFMRGKTKRMPAIIVAMRRRKTMLVLRRVTKSAKSQDRGFSGNAERHAHKDSDDMGN